MVHPNFPGTIVQPENYDSFSTYYRELFKLRNHFEAQNSLLLSIFQQFGIGCESWIYDAACGTGDVVATLARLGFSNIYGSDGASGMISQSERPELTSVCNWKTLDNKLVERAWDCIFLLGLSLLHAPSTDITQVLVTLHKNIARGGIVLVDTRPWTISPDNGRLVQLRRTTGIWRPLGSFSTPSETLVSAHDWCEYQGDQQNVIYRFTLKTSSPVYVPVSFVCLDASTIKTKLLDVGFTKVFKIKQSNWPNIVLAAQR